MTKARDLANLGAYDTIEPTASGLLVTGEATVTGTVSVGSNFTQNSQQSASGGGNISYSGTHLNWTDRFITIANGKSATTSTNGYFEISPLASGQTVTGLGTTADRTTTAAGIPMAEWESLWYILPLGSGSATVVANYRIGAYASMFDVVIPSHWILVATTNGDAGVKHVKTCAGRNVVEGTTSYPDTGHITPTLLNGWVGYGGVFSPAYYSRKNNIVTLIGLVKNGTTGKIFTLPVGFRPVVQLLAAATTSNNVHGRLDVELNGDVVAGPGYSTTWFSVACSFDAA